MTYKVTEEGNISTVFLTGEIDMDVTEKAKEQSASARKSVQSRKSANTGKGRKSNAASGREERDQAPTVGTTTDDEGRAQLLRTRLPVREGDARAEYEG